MPLVSSWFVKLNRLLPGVPEPPPTDNSVWNKNTIMKSPYYITTVDSVFGIKREDINSMSFPSVGTYCINIAGPGWTPGAEAENYFALTVGGHEQASGVNISRAGLHLSQPFGIVGDKNLAVVYSKSEARHYAVLFKKDGVLPIDIGDMYDTEIDEEPDDYPGEDEDVNTDTKYTPESYKNSGTISVAFLKKGYVDEFRSHHPLSNVENPATTAIIPDISNASILEHIELIDVPVYNALENTYEYYSDTYQNWPAILRNARNCSKYSACFINSYSSHYDGESKIEYGDPYLSIGSGLSPGKYNGIVYCELVNLSGVPNVMIFELDTNSGSIGYRSAKTNIIQLPIENFSKLLFFNNIRGPLGSRINGLFTEKLNSTYPICNHNQVPPSSSSPKKRNTVSYISWVQSDLPVLPPEPPLTPGGTTNPDQQGGGGVVGPDGNYEEQDDPVPTPEAPDIVITKLGFFTIYKVTPLNLKDFASYLWSDLFSTDQLKKLFTDPMDMVIGLALFPCTPDPAELTDCELAFGPFGSGVMAKSVDKYTRRYSCGKIKFREYWGSALDYSPYTSVSIFLPYIGERKLDVDDVMNKEVEIFYTVDFISGSCVAFIEVNGTVLYQFSGSCATPIPVTAKSWTNLINTTLKLAADAVSTGASIVAGGAGASTPLQAKRAMADGIAAGVSFAANAAVQTVMSMKPQFQRTGSVSGTTGLLGVQKPYLIVKKPNQQLPYNYQKYNGYPASYSDYIKNLKGYTVISGIHLENIAGITSEEIEELKSILEGGFFA